MGGWNFDPNTFNLTRSYGVGERHLREALNQPQEPWTVERGNVLRTKVIINAGTEGSVVFGVRARVGSFARGTPQAADVDFEFLGDSEAQARHKFLMGVQATLDSRLYFDDYTMAHTIKPLGLDAKEVREIILGIRRG